MKDKDMKEELITFETAKLAKDKGFDWKVRHHYRNGKMYNKELVYGGNPYNMNDNEEQKLWDTSLYSAPTQSLLQKWLREVHKLYVSVDCSVYGEENRYAATLVGLLDGFTIYDTFEKALEEGLQEALKLIKDEESN